MKLKNYLQTGLNSNLTHVASVVPIKRFMALLAKGHGIKNVKNP